MKSSFMLLFLLWSLSASQPVVLTLSLSNFESVLSEMYIAVYKGPHGFLTDPRFSYTNFTSPITSNDFNKKLRVQLTLPGNRHYALAVYQDVNGDTLLERNIFGIPAEPWGVSGPFGIIYGKPAYKRARFKLVSETNIFIKLLN
ncbi:MAG TPA: DUF2141 domain-containing protein [Spirochaetota bacterium]|nr:DUF2141 domain-containing protein [Spirochaetota bacterium]